MVVVTNALMMVLFDKEALMGNPDETYMNKDIENTYPKKNVNVVQFVNFFNFGCSCITVNFSVYNQQLP